MNDYKEFFKDKKITVMGLGLLGGVGDIRFLAEAGAHLIITDLKTEAELKPSLKVLKKFPNIRYTLGHHDFRDFKNRDLIIRAPSTPLDSMYIKEAIENKIPITMWAALFSEFAQEMGVKIVGVTGTRGKTTTTAMITKILSSAGKKVVSGGNVQGTSLLPSLARLTPKTIVVLELDSWKLQGFNDLKISPDVAVFTNFFPDHLNYYKGSMKRYFSDKAYIFKYQKLKDVFIVGSQAVPFIKKWGGRIQSKIVVPKAKLPKGWTIPIPGEHNIYNAALALETVRVLGVKDIVTRKALKNFKGVPHRLEFVKEVKEVKIYNDTTSTTPVATSVAIQALRQDLSGKNIILIMGGTDKDLDFKNLLKDISKYVKSLVLIPGNGTDRIRGDLKKIKVPMYEKKNLKEVVKQSDFLAQKGDIILFSPAFTSFGMFNNEYDRGEKFMKIIKKLR